MSEILARVVSPAIEGPRGPDVLHRVRVKREWLLRGDVVELELPRNLACAACSGGGCDTCERSGAITLRSRDEPAEVVEVTLPARAAEELPREQGITLRIPEQGGLPAEGSELPRGVLLLTVVPGAKADASIKLLRGLPSKRPPEVVRIESPESAARQPLQERKRSQKLLFIAVLLVVAVLLVLLIWLRLSAQR